MILNPSTNNYDNYINNKIINNEKINDGDKDDSFPLSKNDIELKKMIENKNYLIKENTENELKSIKIKIAIKYILIISI
jgi:hypothetical protein